MPRPPNHDRESAIARAVSLFWEKGYHGSSMKQIEQALDMRPGSIYATFGSKDGLYSEALTRYAEAGGAELAEHMAGYDSIVDGLQDYLRRIARGCTGKGSAPSRACLIVKTLLESSNTHPGLSKQAQAILGAIEQSFANLLEKAREQGELAAATNSRRLARLLQSQILGLRSIAERNLPDAELEALGDDMARILEAYRAS